MNITITPAISKADSPCYRRGGCLYIYCWHIALSYACNPDVSALSSWEVTTGQTSTCLSWWPGVTMIIKTFLEWSWVISHTRQKQVNFMKTNRNLKRNKTNFAITWLFQIIQIHSDLEWKDEWNSKVIKRRESQIILYIFVLGDHYFEFGMLLRCYVECCQWLKMASNKLTLQLLKKTILYQIL